MRTDLTSDYATATLRAMTYREIRRAQAIAQAQIPMAHAQGNADALEWLQAADDLYAAELVRRAGSREAAPTNGAGVGD